MDLRIYEIRDGSVDLSCFEWFRSLRQSSWIDSQTADVVAKIVGDVATEGDEAVVRYMQKWTDPGFTTDRIVVEPRELTQALDRLDRDLRGALEQAIDNVRTYQRHIKPADAPPIHIAGADLGLRFTPVDSVGLAVPGGKAAYPSTVVMLAVPALVAGVEPDSISVITPPPTRSPHESVDCHAGDISTNDVSPLVLATCALLGIRNVYRIGGAQGVAALAIGTQSVPAVDMIAGPGNIYTQLAKQQVSGRVGIDGFYGPSEIVVIADESADPACVASDLIAQAEHDPGRCFLIAWSQAVIERINNELTDQLHGCTRREAVEQSLQQWSAALLVKDEHQAVEAANQIAAEHVNLAVAQPEAWLGRGLGRVRHGGEFFLGDQTPVAAGDYWAGPSHCLPTGTTARFASGVSVYTFLKRSGTVFYRDGMAANTMEGIAKLAEAEGLDAHAASVRSRTR